MKTKRLLTAAALAALTILLGGATLRSKTTSGPAARFDPAPQTITSSPDGDYIWDPVDRYWERDRNGRRDH